MSRWRRAAALLGVVALFGLARSLSAQSITLNVVGLKADSMPPGPNMQVVAVDTRPDITYSIMLDLSTENLFNHPFFSTSAPGLTATFHLDSLLTPGTPVFMRAQLKDQFGVVAATTTQAHIVQGWLKLDTPQQQPLVSLGTRRPLFAWSSPTITLPPGLWQYDFAVVNNRTGIIEQFKPFLNDTSFVPDSLESNTSYYWQVTARGQNSTSKTEVTVRSSGTFVIGSATQPTFTLFYQNFPNPFGRGERSPITCLWFDLDRQSTVKLSIFDLRLHHVKTIVPGQIGNGSLPAGAYGRQNIDAQTGCDPSLVWDGRDDTGRFVPPGVYLAQFIANGKSQTIKMMYNGPP